MMSREELKAHKQERNQAILDRVMGKFASRRLWVWLLFTLIYFCFAMVYIFTESAIDGDVMNHVTDKWVEVSEIFLAVVGVDNIVQSWKGSGD